MGDAPKRLRDDVVPCHARDDQAVDIHWRRRNNEIYIERRECPPAATIDAKKATE